MVFIERKKKGVIKLKQWRNCGDASYLSFEEKAINLSGVRAEATGNVSAVLLEECLWLIEHEAGLGIYHTF